MRDTIDGSRVFEYTNKSISDRFKPDGVLDLQKVLDVPAIFASEVDGSGAQSAKVGYITRVRDAGKSIRIDYSIDPGIPPITIDTLKKLSTELEIEEFEFFRTHWAVKDVDLFEMLLREHLSSTPRPMVFTLDPPGEIDDHLVSIMMPLHSGFDGVFETLRHTAEGLGLKCLRADDIWEHDAIVQDIVSLICRSRVVVCDCTGRNANVFYEIGIAHTLGKQVILITQQEQDIPFDLRHLRYAVYLNNSEGLQDLAMQLKSRLETILVDEPIGGVLGPRLWGMWER